jgi:hypothetical protein
MTRIFIAFALAASLGGQAPEYRPKETVKLVLNGPGLRDNVEITDRAAIAGNVYAGNFMTTQSEEPNQAWPRYRVEFYVFSLERGVTLRYAVVYVRDSKTGAGFVYLPGRGEPDYRLNIGTIIRDGSESPGLQPARDGQWQHAAGDWSAALNAHLPRPA